MRARIYLEAANEMQPCIRQAQKLVTHLELLKSDDFVDKMVLERARSTLFELLALQNEMRFAAQNHGAC